MPAVYIHNENVLGGKELADAVRSLLVSFSIDSQCIVRPFSLQYQLLFIRAKGL